MKNKTHGVFRTYFLTGLQTSVSNGAKFIGVAYFYGGIQKGKASDILILDTFPHTNIQAIELIDIVFSNGRLHTKAT